MSLVSWSVCHGICVYDDVCRRPVNAGGNSWADRVRGVQHQHGSAMTVDVMSEVTEDVAVLTTGPANDVQTQQPQQQSAVTVAPGKLSWASSSNRSHLTASDYQANGLYRMD